MAGSISIRGTSEPPRAAVSGIHRSPRKGGSRQKDWPPALKNFSYRFLKPNSSNPEYKHDDSFELDLLEKFQADPNLPNPQF